MTTKWENHPPFDPSHQFSSEGSARPARPVAHTAADRLSATEVTAEVVKIDETCSDFQLIEITHLTSARQIAAGGLANMAGDLETTATTAKDRY